MARMYLYFMRACFLMTDKNSSGNSADSALFRSIFPNLCAVQFYIIARQKFYSFFIEWFTAFVFCRIFLVLFQPTNENQRLLL